MSTQEEQKQLFWWKQSKSGTVPQQCKQLRRDLRKKRQRLQRWMTKSLQWNSSRVDSLRVNFLIVDYCIPPHCIVDAIEHLANKRTKMLVDGERTDEKGENNVFGIFYHPERYQGFSMYARDGLGPWGCTVKDLLAIYLGDPKAEGNDDGFVEDALTCVASLQEKIDKSKKTTS